jgi:DNA mismatch repair protein MutS
MTSTMRHVGAKAPRRASDAGSGAGQGAYGEVIRQYLDLRDGHPGVILLFRIGSFYEVLFEDAELVARELGLKLGERPSGGSAPPVPQCGFAHHALDNFLARLLGRGYRVAVCEESAEESDGPRERAVVRTLTPGTVVDPALLREDRPTYLVGIVPGEAGRFGVAWTDLAAGEFKVAEMELDAAAAELHRLDPAEVVVPLGGGVPGVLTHRRSVVAADAAGAADALALGFSDVGALPLELPLASAAGGLILRYLQQTQPGLERTHLEAPARVGAGDGMRLDVATQRHLELVETERAREREGSLLAVLDRTSTPMGRRMLRSWVQRPLTDPAKIALRQRLVGELIASPRLRDGLTELLPTIADLERLAERGRKARASAEDLRALAAAAVAAACLGRVVAGAGAPFLRSLGRERPRLRDYAARAEQLLPASAADGRVRSDASPELAEAHRRVQAAAAWRAAYLAELRQRRGLDKARIDRTSTQGYFIEVPANTAVPTEWIRRGGLQKVERYSTAALEQHAIEQEEAERRLADAEQLALDELRAKAATSADEARDLARGLAATDALLSLAVVATERGWVMPTVDDGAAIEIVGGRHPVLDAGGGFRPNDARLVARGDQAQLVVLTGPNMAGKSTWMRQIALIVLLAQVGSCVPAERARIGLVDAIFTRIGAVDDLAEGRSTFMVEMTETASVLAHATDRSLVLLDEIGRGTSTHDGMAIAWAVIEHLAAGPVRPRAVVATHYHELAALRRGLPQVSLLRAGVEERPDGVVFTHRIEPGAADRSFGIEVARLAGLPPAVLERARQVADTVEPLTAEIAQQLAGEQPRLRRVS